ncbi:MAG: hypothetical protein QOC61_248 [Acidobacteriota bacterium]|nr:hypothetical protein [Acidobacteriota bacterium]
MMLEGDPDNTAVMFGLAKEYEKVGRFDDMIEVLSDYLQRADDEGNAYGMLAAAYLKIGNRDAARRRYSVNVSTTSPKRPSFSYSFASPNITAEFSGSLSSSMRKRSILEAAIVF